MRAPNFDIEELIQHLQGSCMSMQEAVSGLYEGMDKEDLTQEDRNRISFDLYRCDTCDWWYETGDEDEDGNCESCSTCDMDDDENEWDEDESEYEDDEDEVDLFFR